MIIGSGTCSVVVSCNYDSKTPTVNKIFKQDSTAEFERELNMLDKIVKIQDYTHFTVPMISTSKICTNILPQNVLDKLKVTEEDGELHQITFGYGGICINEMKKHILFKDALILIYNFFVGLQRLHNNGLIHRDIKPNNVLFQQEPAKFNIIDFGLACVVDDVYSVDEKFILSYQYMYNPPEFYIASLLLDSDDIDNVFKPFMEYTRELEVFYREHYYNYNKREPYNIFQYKKAFTDFYNTIKSNGLTVYSDIFTREIAYKSDVYSSSFVLKYLRQNIIFDSVRERQVLNELLLMTSALNPYERSSVSELINYCSTNLKYYDEL